jgi:hypothetical protein
VVAGAAGCARDVHPNGGDVMRRLLGVALAWLSLTGLAHAQGAVALFFDPLYVDTSPAPDGEATNLLASLQQLGYTVTTFTGTSEAEWRSAMGGKQLLVIPELEISPLSPALDVTTKLFIASFVSRGGTLIVFAPRSGDPLAILNEAFEFGMTAAQTTTPPISLTAEASGTPFEGGPATLPMNLSSVDAVLASSLPGGSRIIYADADGNGVVTQILYQGGNILILGWDWFDAAPLGAQDGGWLPVLDAAGSVRGINAIPTLSEWAMIAMAALLVLVGVASLGRRGGPLRPAA